MTKSKLGNLNNLASLTQRATQDPGLQVLRVPVDQVVSEKQVRTSFENLEELAASMKADGQQSPVIVSPKNDQGHYVIQKGERRWRAAKINGWARIDVIVKVPYANQADEVASQLIENIQRDDLNPLEIANALQVFLDHKWTAKAISERLGKSKSYVSAHLGLLKLPKHVTKLSAEGICQDATTLNNLRLLDELDSKACQGLCALAMEDRVISRSKVRDTLAKAKVADGVSDVEPATTDEVSHAKLDSHRFSQWAKGGERSLISITVWRRRA